MAEILCGYTADRDETLIAYLYGEIEPVQRAAFEGHIATCERCRRELADLQDVRQRLQEWPTPDAEITSLPAEQLVTRSFESPRRGRVLAALREIPAWAQVAAALLFLGVSAGIANLDVRFDNHGVSVHTGWSRAVPTLTASNQPGPAGAAADAAWRADMDALERRLRAELGNQNRDAARASTVTAGGATEVDAPTLQRVRTLINESERRQQNDVALRIGGLAREFDAKLANTAGGLRAAQTNTGIEVKRQGEWLDLLTTVSMQK